jgi:hypothetical protein
LKLAVGDDPVRAAEVDDVGSAGVAVVLADGGAEAAAAQQPFDYRPGQAGPVGDPADRPAAFT